MPEPPVDSSAPRGPGGPARVAAWVTTHLRLAWFILRESVLSFADNRHFSGAATLSFYAFLALMPLLLVVMWILVHVLSASPASLQALEEVATTMLGSNNRLVLGEVTAIASSRAPGFLGFALLLWSVTPLAGAARESFDVVFRVVRTDSIAKAKLWDVVAATLLLTLLVATVGSKALLALLPDRLTVAINQGAPGVLAGMVGTVLTLAFLYRAFAPVRPHFTDLFLGAAVATVLLFLMRQSFGVLLRFRPDYGYAFGSLQTIFLLMVWIYWTFATLLFGAEVMSIRRRREALLLRPLLHPRRRVKTTFRPLLSRFVVRLDEGEILFSAGDPGREMYYVLQGSVTLCAGAPGGAVQRTLRPGQYFGELALLEAETRTGSAVAGAPDTQLVQISRANFETIVRENPEIVRAMLEEMARHIAAAESVSARP